MNYVAQQETNTASLSIQYRLAHDRRPPYRLIDFKEFDVEDRCAICGCKLKKQGVYGEDTQRGRSHPTKHHYVAERFFGRSANRKHKKRTPIFDDCPWNFQGKPKYFCYDCHEELLHNPVLLPADIEGFAKLVKLRNLAEVQKASRKDKLACRIMLLHEVIATGINELLKSES